MTQPAKVQEPSMEEILASIRRIIADDDAAKPPPKPGEPAKPAAAAPPPAEKPRPAAPPPPPPKAAITQEPAEEIDFVRAGAIAVAEPSEPADIDVLELTESMAAPPEAPASSRKPDGRSDAGFREFPPARPIEPAAPPRQPVQPAQPAERPLLSSATSSAIDSAFNTLAHTVLVQNARTLEDLVREMLRPMLKGWLDDNLPSMVERIVRAEIERVSRGRA
jgi:cell pole-organizing protein PopZ